MTEYSRCSTSTGYDGMHTFESQDYYKPDLYEPEENRLRTDEFWSSLVCSISLSLLETKISLEFGIRFFTPFG